MKDTRIDYVLDGIAFAGSMAQTELLLKYISLGLTILATCISIAYSLYKWWKKAKEDGKITKEELKDGIDIIKDHLKDKDKED